MTETSKIWTSKASSYDRARPAPPLSLKDVLEKLPEVLTPNESGAIMSNE